MLDLLVWPVSATVQLIYSSLTLVVSVLLWIFSSLLPQLLGALLSVSSGLFAITTNTAPVVFDAICTTVVWLVSLGMWAFEVIIGFSVAAVETVWAVVVLLFASLWTGCQIGVDFLLTCLPLLGRWLAGAAVWLVSSSISASQLLISVGSVAATAVWGAMATLFAGVWMGCQLLWSFLSAFLLTLGGWAGEAAYLTAQAGSTVVECISSLPWADWVAGTLGYVGSSLNAMAKWVDEMGDSVSSGNQDKHFPSESPQDSSVLPSWQQMIGLVLAAVVLILVTEYIARFLYRRQQIHVAADQVILEDRRQEETPRHDIHEEVEPYAGNPSYQLRSPANVSVPERRQRRPHPLSPASRRTHPVQEENSDGLELQTRVRELTAKLEREEERKLCVVCLDRHKEVLLRPCNHYCVCSHCLRALGRRCPICRKMFRTSEKLYHV